MRNDRFGQDTAEESAPGASPRSAGDLAGREFWERNWAGKRMYGQYNPGNYTHRRYDAFFRRQLAGAAGRTLLEVGCAQSSWLPYFHRAHGLRVAGIDYSPTGCDMARRLLEAADVPGDIRERDLFAENPDLEETADYLFSLGFIEHFEDPVDALRRMRRILKPGGTILTIVPNFAGWLGAVQKFVHPEVYRMHIILDLSGLGRIHRQAGFAEVEAGYLGSIASEVVKYPDPSPLRLRILRKVLKKITKTGWLLFRATGWHPETASLSPYIAYVGIRSDGDAASRP